MKVAPIILSGLCVAVLSETARIQAVQGPEIARRAVAITYPSNRQVAVWLRGTSRLPEANGVAKVDRRQGDTKLAIQLDDLKPATLFGGDYSTYVLWVASPGGGTTNLGEFVLDGDRSELNVRINLATFAIFVTAEPHFLAATPSRFVVLETVSRVGTTLEATPIKYRGFEGFYNFVRWSLQGTKEAKGTVRTSVKQAFTAVKLAQRASAMEFARGELSEAQRALDATVALDYGRADIRTLEHQAHETVRLAVEAEMAARQHAFAAIPAAK